MEDGVIQRVSELIEDSGKSVAKFAEGIGIAQSALFKYLNGINKPSLALVYGVLESDKNVSSEWLLRGEGEKYKTDVPREGDSEEMEDLRIELTKVHAERDELRQVVEDLKRQAKEWRESDEYKQIIEDLRAEAAELRARLDEQRTNFRVLADSMGRQQPAAKPVPIFDTSTGTIQLVGAEASPRVANAAKRVAIRTAIAEAKAAKAPRAKRAKGPESV